MRCPFCNNNSSRTYATRQFDEYVKRKKICNGCGNSFTTLEYTEQHIEEMKSEGSNNECITLPDSISLDEASIEFIKLTNRKLDLIGKYLAKQNSGQLQQPVETNMDHYIETAKNSFSNEETSEEDIEAWAELISSIR